MSMTVEQAFNVAMNEYPSLYTAPTLELAKLKFYDQLFNTIGNGLRSRNDFESKFSITDDNKHLSESFPEKYITDSELYTVGYRKSNESFGSYLPGLYTKEEAEFFMSSESGYYYFRSNRNSDVFIPYPNFQSDYSLVYNIDLTQYDSSWLNAAIEYYSAMRIWFNSEDKSSLYHLAVPATPDEMQLLVDRYEQAFKKYSGDAVTADDYNAAITRAYDIRYTGDTKQFIIDRWSAELNRINTFIAETLNKLQQ